MIVYVFSGNYLFCEPCKNGSYSLISNITSNTQCKYCDNIDSIESCKEDKMNLRQGNYDISNRILY